MSGFDEHGNNTIDFQEFVEWYRDAGPRLAPMQEQEQSGFEADTQEEEEEEEEEEEGEEQEQEQEDLRCISQAYQFDEGNDSGSDDEEEDTRDWHENDDELDEVDDDEVDDDDDAKWFSDEDSQEGEAGSWSLTPVLPVFAESNDQWDVALKELDGRTQQPTFVKLLMQS